jgi:hypothetical protein
MALKPILDTLDGLPPALREHYSKADDGKFKLALEGGHPDTARLAEFRDNNIKLTHSLAKFDGVDPEEYKSLKAKAGAGDAPDVAALRTELATEKAARLDAQKRADNFLIESMIADAFLKAGGVPKARGFIIGLAKDQFSVEGGKLKGRSFSPDRPGEPLSVDEFVTLQTRENSYLFAASSGGGADPKRGGGGTSSVKELRDPSPSDLGRYASEISAGRLKVVYSS